ncbi:MAG: hypothetical protein M1814_000555 [Vezdaea aestivalis]|nr:MAG: hypothetical protein M1814_000555 [Vezdaea aestivalis]
MASVTRPISPTIFAAALTQLPPSALHGKVSEIQNSLAHLTRSNDELEPFAKEGDEDCADAIRENREVISRMEARLTMLKREIENRGLSWHDGETKESEDKISTDGGGENIDQTIVEAPGENRQINGSGGRINDEEMQQRLEAMMRENDSPDDGGIDL